MIEIQDIQKSFDSKQVLDHLNQDFSLSSVHGIIGLNGAGKTTFFNLLSSFVRPDQGIILYNSQKINRTQTAYLETVNFFYSRITGKEYLDIFPGSNQRFDLEAINQLLGLPLNQIVESYSTGMKKKLALLSIIKQDKPVYIFDEPFNGLDLETNRALEVIISNLKQRGKTVFVSSHILSPLITVCDEIHLLQKGRFTNTYQKEDFASIEEELFREFNKSAHDILRNSI